MTEAQPQNRPLGYARVSTYGQTLAAQFDQLKAAGSGKVYREKASGALADRRELLRMLKAISRRRRFEGATLQELAKELRRGAGDDFAAGV
jgi:DNA invertase Pin-like site-specific DNA recombinase